MWARRPSTHSNTSSARRSHASADDCPHSVWACKCNTHSDASSECRSHANANDWSHSVWAWRSDFYPNAGSKRCTNVRTNSVSNTKPDCVPNTVADHQTQKFADTSSNASSMR
jgi:hypothetical protein